MTDEVAVFVDFENLRYSLLTRHGREPDIPAIVAKAKKYGRPSIMRAYADFSEHPPELTRQLQVAGIEAINTPVKRSLAGSTERVSNAADMALALDAVVEAIDADSAQKTKTFLLVTGDADFIRLVTLLRNRFGQNVVVAGVPGAVSRDLELAADLADLFPAETALATDMTEVKKAIVAMVNRGPSPLTYWTLKTIDQWAQDYRQNIPGTVRDRRDAVGLLADEGIFLLDEKTRPDGRVVKEASLDIELAERLGYL